MMRLVHHTTVAALLACGLAVSAAHASAAPTMEDIHAPVQAAPSPGNSASLVRLHDDTLRLYYIIRPSATAVHSVESADGGLTWSEDRFEVALPGSGYHAVHATVDQRGEAHLVFAVRDSGDLGYRGIHFNIWHTRTTGGLSEWEEPRMIFEGYVGALRGFITLEDGRLILPLAAAVPERQVAPPEGEPDYGWNDVFVMYSDDDGETWTTGEDRLSILQDPDRGRTRYGAIEPHVVQLADGRVWMLIRSKNGMYYESYSEDGSVWPQPEPTRFIVSDSPPWVVRLADDRMVLFLNSSQRWDNPRSYAIGGREALHVALTEDGGETWLGFREILRDDQGTTRGDHGTAYPSAVENAEGKVVVTTGQGDDRRAIILFDPDWIKETEQADDFSAGDAQWSMIGSTGTEIVHHPETEGANALSIRKPGRGKPSAAVWNFPMMEAGHLALRLKPLPGWQGTEIALTDHFSVSNDMEANDNAVYQVRLPRGERLKTGEWNDVEITFRESGSATMSINGNVHTTLEQGRAPRFGLNYLRLTSSAEEPDLAGILVERVSVRAAGGE